MGDMVDGMQTHLMESVIWLALLGAIAFPIRAIMTRSAAMMWVALLCSLVLSMAGLLSVGFLTFLLSCLQLGAAIVLRWRLSKKEAAGCLAVAGLVWLVVVPGQMLGPALLPWLLAFPLVILVGSLALVVNPSTYLPGTMRPWA